MKNLITGSLVLFLTFLIIITFIRCAYALEMDLTKAVIHHTATKDVPIITIRHYHVKVKKWDDVGYHYLIRKNGNIEEGRPLTKRGAHAPGRNHWIGIALTGKDFFTVHQLTSLYDLLKRLKVEYIEPHYLDYACPGRSLEDFITTYNKEAK